MNKPQVTRIGCYAVISEQSNVLLCRLCDGLDHHGKWTLPGGGLNFGETLEEAVVREVQEETGLEVTVRSLLSHSSSLWKFPDKQMHSFQFLFSVNIVDGYLTHEVNGSTDRVEWIDLNSVTENNAVDIVLRAKALLKLPFHET